MAQYQITFARSARRDLDRLPLDLARRILDRIRALDDKPRPRGCRKLAGPNQLWRIRVGEYRIIYGVDDSAHVVDVVIVRHRSDAYR